MRRILAPLSLVLLTAGCGPTTGLHFTITERPASLAYGDQARPTPPPPVTAGVNNPGFPGIVAPPPSQGLLHPTGPTPAPSASPGVVVQAPACPDTSPFTSPDQPAAPVVTDRPVDSDYVFRRSGHVKQGDTDTPLAPLTARDVRNSRFSQTPVDLGTPNAVQRTLVSFDVTQVDADGQITVSYLVDQGGADPGIKITGVTGTGTRGGDTFSPSQPLTLMTLPAGPQATAQNSAATDPTRQVAIKLTHQTTKHERVAACGAAIEAWHVELVGTILYGGTRDQLNFTGSLDLAPQYGGLVVGESINYDGSYGGSTLAAVTTSTINRVPDPPVAP